MEKPDKPVALVLGGTVPHAELLRKLKRRGYFTVLVDYFDNPPAAYAADVHSTASAMDYEAVLEVARHYGAQLVMSSCLDQQLVIAMRVSEALGLPHPFSSELALTVTNKTYMKKIMMEHGIPTSRYYAIGADDGLAGIELDYPAIVKPADCSGSAGVCKLESPEGLQGAVEKARSWSHSGGVIVEEFKRGIEVSVYAYVKGGRAKVVTTAQRMSVLTESQTRCYAVVSPAKLPDGMRERLDEVGTQIALAFGLENTPLFFQVILNGDDVSVLELAPRLGGGMSYRTMQLNTCYDLMEASIESYFGRAYEPEPSPEKSRYFIQLLYGLDGVFDHLEGYESLVDDGIVEEIHPMKTKGMEIGNEKASSSRCAVMLIEGRTDDEFFAKLDEAMSRLEIRDPDGKPLLDRSYQLTRKTLEGSKHAPSEA